MIVSYALVFLFTVVLWFFVRGGRCGGLDRAPATPERQRPAGQRSPDRRRPLCERGPAAVRAGRQWTGRERRGRTQDTAVVLFDYPLIQLINRLSASIVFRATPSHGAAGTEFFLNQ